MKLNGRMIVALLLLCFWLYLAYSAFSNGNPGLACVYLAIGGALTAWRLKNANA